MIPIINQSLLEANTKYIAHQCNCKSNYSAGLAKSIFTKFPYSDTYKDRIYTGYNFPGRIDVLGNGEDNRFIINMYIQFWPGKPGKDIYDTNGYRIKHLKQCLSKIAEISNLESIGFPYNLGCGLAGGNFIEYSKILETFADYVSKKNVKTVLYKYD